MIHFVGDINLTDGFFDTGIGVGSKIDNGINPFESFDRQNGDIWIGNLECVISDVSIKTGLYKEQFRISPSRLKSLQHFNIYGFANNHAMQHGAEAYQETLIYLNRLGVKCVGTNVYRTLTFEHCNKTVSILAFSQRKEKYASLTEYWYSPEYKDIESEFQKISNSDYKIAYIHWGIEFMNKPYVDQKQFAHWLIDLGFDLIIGMHAHVLQGFEIYKGKRIYYSLGNFVFNMSYTPTKYSIILNLDVESTVLKLTHICVYIDDNGFPKIIEEDDVPPAFRFEYLNTLLKIEEDNETYYADAAKALGRYRMSNRLNFLKNIFKIKLKIWVKILIDFIQRRHFSYKK
ncbi:CapA family protein [Bacteroides nordii]|uniref:CapA family protein n=1 Tax=Bacteroides nordii TaxID=291645 RepID=UPI0026DB39EB|nr:CapA family protein [Bacteroides nordii]